jgi:serine/threonine protein kinase
MILGTAGYMSPEQARGKPVDKRADIWAFGVLLYEMLTGKRLFQGETISDKLAQVLTKEPDWEQVPAKVRRLLQSCLQKDARQRLQAIGDWRLLLTDEQPQTAPAPKSKLPWAVAAVLAAALVIAFWAPWHFTKPVDRPLMRLSVDLGRTRSPVNSPLPRFHPMDRGWYFRPRVRTANKCSPRDCLPRPIRRYSREPRTEETRFFRPTVNGSDSSPMEK